MEGIVSPSILEDDYMMDSLNDKQQTSTVILNMKKDSKGEENVIIDKDEKEFMSALQTAIVHFEGGINCL